MTQRHSIRFTSWPADLAALPPDLRSRMVEFSAGQSYRIQCLVADQYLLRLGQGDYIILSGEEAIAAILALPETPAYVPPQPREPDPAALDFLADLGL